jgi:excisionase family DNA binding protein
VTALKAERQTGDEDAVGHLPLAAEVSARELLTTIEAAALLQLSATRVAELAARGHIVAVRLNRRWLLKAGSVQSYTPRRARPRAPTPSVPAEPFLRLLDGRGGAAACGVRQHAAEEKAIERARRSGVLTEEMADRLSIALLGLTPWEIWGHDTLTDLRRSSSHSQACALLSRPARKMFPS